MEGEQDDEDHSLLEASVLPAGMVTVLAVVMVAFAAPAAWAAELAVANTNDPGDGSSSNELEKDHPFGRCVTLSSRSMLPLSLKREGKRPGNRDSGQRSTTSHKVMSKTPELRTQW